MTDKRPAEKLFDYLLEDSTIEDIETIKHYTKQSPTDVVLQGDQISEVVNRCLDSEDELTFQEAFNNGLD